LNKTGAKRALERRTPTERIALEKGVRRSVKFPLEAKPLAIQISDVTATDISLIVSPD
jgi:hypothetical protein